MTALAPPTLTKARQFPVDRTDGADGTSHRRLLILGGLSGVAAGLLFFVAQAAIPWDHDLPLELPRREAVLGFWLHSRGYGKSSMFAGSDGGASRWATVASLIATAKLNDVEPFAYLKDVLERMSNDHPMSRLDELLPWNWGRMQAAA